MRQAGCGGHTAVRRAYAVVRCLATAALGVEGSWRRGVAEEEELGGHWLVGLSGLWPIMRPGRCRRPAWQGVHRRGGRGRVSGISYRV